MSVKRAVMAAYMLGSSGHPPEDGMIDELIERANVDDSAIWQELASLKRDVASLRRMVESLGPHKIIAMKRE
jgi:hypothetical protein